MMEMILNNLYEIAGIVVAAFLSYLANKAVKEWRMGKFVDSLVKAAEQLFDKDMDENGELRLSYVKTMLIDAGYKLTDALRAEIEAKVYDLNKAQKE